MRYLLSRLHFPVSGMSISRTLFFIPARIPPDSLGFLFFPEEFFQRKRPKFARTQGKFANQSSRYVRTGHCPEILSNIWKSPCGRRAREAPLAEDNNHYLTLRSAIHEGRHVLTLTPRRIILECRAVVVPLPLTEMERKNEARSEP